MLGKTLKKNILSNNNDLNAKLIAENVKAYFKAYLGYTKPAKRFCFKKPQFIALKMCSKLLKPSFRHMKRIYIFQKIFKFKIFWTRTFEFRKI